MDKDYKSIAFFAYKRTDGFEVSLTFRGDSGTEVISLTDKAIEALKLQGATPVSKNFTKNDTKPSGGMCSKHQIEMKLNKNSKPYHSRGTYPEMEFCNGRGFPSELPGQSGQEIANKLNGGDY